MDKIAVLDFGGQYAHLLAKRIRDLGVYADILSPSSPTHDLMSYQGLVLSGGPATVHREDATPYNPELFSLSIPMLGICYGHQLMAHVLGGKTVTSPVREDGFARLEITQVGGIFERLESIETVWMSHGVTVTAAPPGFDIIATTKDCPVAGMVDLDRKWYGIQFHPEVTHTPKGRVVLDNFLSLIAIRRQWQVEEYVPLLIEKIQKQAGNRNVFIMISGGVDSTVCYVLLNQALGKDRVYGLHVDTGFMRKNESNLVTEALQRIGLDNFHTVEAEKEFLEALTGIIDPEEKRHIIGRLFLEIQQRELAKLDLDPNHWLLGQGTLYPDTIESGGTAHADTIKTHHNRVPEVQRLIDQGLVVEPVAELYKDEVRKVGVALGLPETLVWRHTFPGPGLAVQSLCSSGKSEVENLEQITGQLAALAEPAGYDCSLLPIKSVGVQGDGRTYAHVAALRGPQDWEKLKALATQITNGVRAVNRVVYLLSPADLRFADLRLKAAILTKPRLDVHREADFIANQILQSHQLERELYEFPVIMVPMGLGSGETIVLRPLYSENVMTVEFAKLPWDVVHEMADLIRALPEIDVVLYDVTNKPPGTVQWE